MSRRIGLAYALTGAAVAASVIAVTASVTGLGAATGGTTSAAATVTSGAPINRGDAGTLPGGGTVTVTEGNVDYVYVDEPAARRQHDEDDDQEYGRARGLFARLFGGEHEDDDD